MQWNCYTVEFIYTIVPQTYTICGHIYIQINSLPAEGTAGARARGFPGNAIHKTELRSQTLLYQTLYARRNKNDIQNFLKTVGFHQKYSDIKTSALGFDFETCRAQTSVLPTCQPVEIQWAGFSICDVTNKGKQLCSPNLVFCSSWKGIFKKRNISLWSGLLKRWDLKLCRSFYAQTYTLHTD